MPESHLQASHIAMRIGLLIPEFPGQTHIFFWREARALRRLGIEVDLVSTRRPPPGIVSHDWSKAAMETTHYLAPPGPRQALGAARALLAAGPIGWTRCVRSLTRAQGLSGGDRVRVSGLALMGAQLADLGRARGWSHLHVHSCADSAAVALFARLLSGLPYSLTLHGPLGDYGPNQREKWRHASFGLVITRKLLDEVRAELAGSLPPLLDVAPMGVDLSGFRRSLPYAPWEGVGPLRVFSCGRLNPCKGHADLVRAVQLVAGRGIDARLTIAGEDETGGDAYHKTLASLIDALGVSDRVQLLGAVSESRVRDELEQAHVFALASLAEPLGVAIMEAMAMSVPVVVTGAGGVPELVDRDVDGLLVDPRDPAAMADRIEQLARNPARARELGERGREKVERAFQSDRSAAVLERCMAAVRDGLSAAPPEADGQPLS
jgi:colanic acid/amylovoran biosynthesis glycosyltransferase